MKEAKITTCARLLEECVVGGAFWNDLSVALDNVVVVYKDNLAEVFLDDQIRSIMNSFHGGHYPKETWSAEHKHLVLGP